MNLRIVLIAIAALFTVNVWGQTNTFPPTGNVGIGTMNPDYPFELNSNKGGGGMFSLLNTSGAESSISYRIGNNNINTGWVVGNYFDDYFFYSYTKGSQTVTFKPNGYVGIGTNSPSAKLDVQDSNTSNLLCRVWNTNTSATGSSSIRIANSGNNNNGSRLEFSDNNYYVGTISSDRNQGIVFRVGRGSNPLNMSERMRISQNGNIGIGTIETGTHKLAVEGTIGAREIKVEATGWSDFVFNSDYKLKPLDEVESFIEENNHLPNVPSEKEVMENGIALGEMDAKLLQKIEELTLYMIEMNKRVKSVEDENKLLKEEIKTLKPL